MKLALVLALLSSAATPMRIANPRAPGAPALLRAIELKLPVLGIFQPSTAKVVNHFIIGEHGVRGHSDALPPQLDRSDAGGYTLLFDDQLNVTWRPSGGVFSPITARVERALERYFGLKKAFAGL